MEFARGVDKRRGASEEALVKSYPELVTVKVDAAGKQLLQLFHDIDSSRETDIVVGMGAALTIPRKLRFSEMKAYADLVGWKLTTWEIATLMRMDKAYMEGHFGDLKTQEA